MIDRAPKLPDRVEAIEQALQTWISRISTIEKNVGINDNAKGNVNQRLQTLEEQLVIARASNLPDRYKAIEAAVQHWISRIATIESDLGINNVAAEANANLRLQNLEEQLLIDRAPNLPDRFKSIEIAIIEWTHRIKAIEIHLGINDGEHEGTPNQRLTSLEEQMLIKREMKLPERFKANEAAAEDWGHEL